MKKLNILFIVMAIVAVSINLIYGAGWDSSTDMQALTVSSAFTQTQNNFKAIDGTSSSGPASIVKAWVNFDGNSPATINDSFNTASVTRNSVGDYTISWTNNFANSTYVIAGSASGDGNKVHVITLATTGGFATSSVQITTRDAATNSPEDCTRVNVIAIGDN